VKLKSLYSSLSKLLQASTKMTATVGKCCKCLLRYYRTNGTETLRR